MFKIGDEVWLVDGNDRPIKTDTLVVTQINKKKEIIVRRLNETYNIQGWFPSEIFMIAKRRKLPEWF